MKRALMGLLLAVWMIGGAVPAAGQDDPLFGDPTGCDTGTLEAIEDASPNVDYRALCNEFLACASAGRAANVCQFEAAGRLLETCAADDVLCRNEVLLHVVALTVYTPPFNPNGGNCGWTNDDPYSEAVRQAVLGEYAIALQWLNEWENIAICHPMVSYAAGLIEEMSGNGDAALADYRTSVQVSGPYLTPAIYSRGLLLGEMGRTTEASFDGELLKRFLTASAPVVLPVMAPLTEGFPLDRTPFTTWWVYPVGTKSFSPGGTSVYDSTLEPVIPVWIGDFPELDRLVFLDYPPGAIPVDPHTAVVAVIQVFRESEQDSPYNFYADSLIDGPTFDTRYQGNALTVQVNKDMMLANRLSEGFESGSNTTYLIVAEGTPDPRIGFGARTCEGGVISIITPELLVGSVGLGDLDLQSQPGEEDFQLAQRIAFARLTGEPVCVGADAWWPAVGPDGQTGWLQENRGHSYTLANRALDSLRWMFCPGAPVPRLIFGYSARVLNAPGAGLLRETPSDALLTTFSPGQIIEVGRERTCVDGQVWWQVRTEDGQSGYMAEGDADTYFLELVPEDVP